MGEKKREKNQKNPTPSPRRTTNNKTKPTNQPILKKPNQKTNQAKPKPETKQAKNAEADGK